MRQLFTFVDTYFAAEIGDHAVAGIGLAFPYEFLMVAFWVGTSTGMTSLLSRALGAHEGAKLDQVVRVTRGIVVLLVPIFMALGAAIWVRPSLFVSDGVTPETLEQFRIYGAVILGGTALTGFWSIIPDSIVKAHHDTRATMWAGIASNLLNVGCNWVFVRIFHWGMFGIAFSTVLGRLGGLGYALFQAARHEARRRAAARDTVPGLDPHALRSILALAVPAAVAYVLMATESTIVNALLARSASPTESLAAYSIYYRYLMFFLMPVVACGVALLPFTARAWGRRDVATIRRAFRDVALAGAAYVVLLVLPVTWLLREPLVARFATAALTRELTQWCLLVLPLAALVAIPFFACRPIFEGLQRGAPGMTMAALRYAVLTAPVAWIGAAAARHAGWPELRGVVLALVGVTACVSCVFLLWMLAALRRAEEAAPAPAAGVAAGA
jgi:Na+-driven multidrug efflux pump